MAKRKGRKANLEYWQVRIVTRRRVWLSPFSGFLIDFPDEVFPQLSLYRGREKLSRKKSSLIVGLLYVSHSFSAWVRVLIYINCCICVNC